MKTAIGRLVALQDLLQLKRDLTDKRYKDLGFETDGVDAIDGEIESLRAAIDPALLRRYETIAGKYERPLVPIRNGVCYGCFVRFPTAQLTASTDPLICESCGRLLYRVT